MTLNLNKPNTGPELKPRIVVVGVGGAGCNAVNNMIDLDLDGVEFIATNTDAQSLAQSRADRRIQLGTNITHGLGSGARPDIGRAAAEEAMDLVIDQLQGGHMAFVTAGMGGGTGTGAAPVIARAAREMGILTVGVVTKPFHFEGSARMEKAEQGLQELQQYVDTLIVIPNQNLFRICNENTTFADAFRLADNVLYSGVRGVTDLMVMPGLINLDFADIRTVMSEMGKAMMGTGEASGDTRAIDAAEAAIANPLLDDVSMKGAKGVLINITGGADMTLFEVDEAANRIRDEVDPKASIIFGSTFDEGLEDVMRVSIVATGIDVEAVAAPRPASVSILSPAERRQPNIAASPADQPSAHPMRAAAGHDIAATAVASASTGGAGYGSRSRDNHIPPVGPSATPATMRDNASQPFIAPRPVEPALGGVAQTPAGDPFTTRIVRPSAPEPRRKKGLNIFQRVSERVAGLHEEPVSQEALIADEAPVSAAGPAADAGYPEPTLTQGEPPETKAAVAEPQLETDPTAPALEPGDELVPEPAAADAETEGNKAPDDPEQQSLKYVETGGPAGPGGSEEDLLEIPAFLRRQAN